MSTPAPEQPPMVPYVEWLLWGRTLRLAIVGSALGAVVGAALFTIWLVTVGAQGALGAVPIIVWIALTMAMPFGLVIALGATIGGTVAKRTSAASELWGTAIGGAVAIAAYLWSTGRWSTNVQTLGLIAIGALATFAFVRLTRRYRRQADPR